MEFKEHAKGLFELTPDIYSDKRGTFLKTLNSDIFAKFGLECNFKEEFYSKSFKNVFRGMHFQLPPFDHVKIVYCISGKVIDFVLDLRLKSETFGKIFSFDLNSETCKILYIPRGFGHGFYSIEDDSIMVYKTSTVHSPKYDSGILWSSINYNWPFESPIISDRDLKFETFESFISKGIF